MPSSIRRRLLISALAVSCASLGRPLLARSASDHSSALRPQLRAIEAVTSGRLGVSGLNTVTGMRIQYRADERFAMCSTCKAFVAAAILEKSRRVPHLLQKRIPYSLKEVQQSGYAPITEKYVGSGMRIGELCAATLQYSDNAAANLLMRELGGPAAVTAYARSIGDDVFRLDRWEPELNAATPGDLRDTSTPAAMESSLQRLMLGDALASAQRDQLIDWLKGNTTGARRMAAGAPKGWVVGDKTGTGAYGSTNDIGILWSPTGAPIAAAIFFTQPRKEASPKEEVLAVVTRLLVEALA